MRLRNVVGIAITLAGCATDGAPNVDTSSDQLAAAGDVHAAAKPRSLAALFQADIDAIHAAGAIGVLGQVRDRDAVFRARAGESRQGTGIPVAFDSKFRMGSNTKTFVAVVVLQLVDEGKLRLDDTVDRWLPGVVSGNGHDGTKITIRQLLQHTSGVWNYTRDLFTEYTPDDYRRTRFQHISPEELVAIAMSHAPTFAPGTGWSYSNTNYILAGMIIEKATGRSWPQEVQSRIVAPLGLTATFDPGDWPDLPAPHAQGYHEFADGTQLDTTLLNHTWGGAAGSLITTADDLTRFWTALQRGELVSPAGMAEMHTTVPAPDLAAILPDARYGLGIMSIKKSCGGVYWSHFGDTTGFSTRDAVSEDGARAVVVSDSRTSDIEDHALAVIGRDVALLDDVMCAAR